MNQKNSGHFKLTNSICLNKKQCTSLCLSPNEQILALACDQEIRIMSLAPNNEVQGLCNLIEHQDQVVYMVLSFNGDTIVSVGRGNYDEILVWEKVQYQQVWKRTFKVNFVEVNSIVFDDLGNQIIVAADKKLIRYGREEDQWAQNKWIQLNCSLIILSHDSSFLAVAKKDKIVVLKQANLDIEVTLKGLDKVSNMTFNTTSTYLICGNLFGHFRFWHRISGNQWTLGRNITWHGVEAINYLNLNLQSYIVIVGHSQKLVIRKFNQQSKTLFSFQEITGDVLIQSVVSRRDLSLIIATSSDTLLNFHTLNVMGK